MTKGIAVSTKPPIPIYRPDLSGNEKRYVLDCMETGWISSLGAYIQRFEDAVSKRTGARHAIAVSNGTVAIHLALHALGVGPGDEVIVPSFTYIASVNTIAQTGATPVFAESRASDWQVDPDHVASLVTSRTRAILPAHLYGQSTDMDAICRIARRHDLAVVEDCAEVLGSTLNGVHLGRMGNASTLSFFGNKTITTGEGGMVITDDDALAAHMRQLKGQGQSLTRRYWHEMLGFNYRMTNIAAAIGTAQMERLDDILVAKRAIAVRYREGLAGLPLSFQSPMEGLKSSEWLVSVLVERSEDRDPLMAALAAEGIETRPVFFPAHHMPMYRSAIELPVAESISARGVSLPSYPELKESDQLRVTEAIRTYFS